MNYKVIIPVRLNSTRLPRKPLKDINGKTLLERVVEQVKKSKANSIHVATDSEEISELCDQIEVNSILTSKTHETGTDRVFETCTKLKLDDDEVILNVQGDEPFIDPNDIDNLACLSHSSKANIATLYTKLTDDEFHDRNVVKLWVESSNKISDFSRDVDHLIPDQAKKHLGIYAYRYEFLKSFVNWDQSANELSRNLEQMRALDNGQPIFGFEAVGKIHLGVDTQLDLEKAIEIAKNLK